MTSLQRSKTIDVPAERIWEIVADFYNAQVFHPMVRRVVRLDGRDELGVGSARRCEFHNGTSCHEEVTHWADGAGFTVTLSGGPMPVKTAEASMRISAVDSDRTKVTVGMAYTPKYGPLGQIMDLLVMRRAAKKSFGVTLDSLEHYALTGEAVGEHGETIPAPQQAA